MKLAILSRAPHAYSTQRLRAAAIDRGQLPTVDPQLLVEMLGGPVHLMISRDAREFTRADAQRITEIVIAGLRATAGVRT